MSQEHTDNLTITPEDEALKRLVRAMSPRGVLAVNLVIGEGHRTLQSETRRRLKSAFPMVRAIRSPHALNEVLVAGREVAGLSALRKCTFSHRLDRVRWAELTQRKL